MLEILSICNPKMGLDPISNFNWSSLTSLLTMNAILNVTLESGFDSISTNVTATLNPNDYYQGLGAFGGSSFSNMICPSRSFLNKEASERTMGNRF